MKTYVTIHGECITGEIANELKNVVIVQSTSGQRHVVHKKSLDANFNATKAQAERKTTNKHFNLEETQQRGPVTSDRRHWAHK